MQFPRDEFYINPKIKVKCSDETLFLAPNNV